MDDDKFIESIDDIITIDLGYCFFCKEELTAKNKSKWAQIVSDSKNIMAYVTQCGLCHEANSLCLKSAEKKGDALVPTISFEECRKKLIADGMTSEVLVAVEESEEAIIQ